VTIDFKGSYYPKSVILYAVFFYVRYVVSYRDLDEIMAERGAEVDHATLNRWVVKYAPLIAANAQARKRPTAVSWRMDETYIKVKGKWAYYYRAVDKTGKTLDFMLSERRDKAAARRFSSGHLAPMACRIGSSSIRAGLIWRACNVSTSS
jgi:putative transposase